MSKRSIQFNKPEDPSFLKRIKESIGYREGPTVDTKRENPEEDFNSEDEDFETRSDLKPEVVVLRPGDLTAEEADLEKARLEREEKEKPADLSQRIVFKKPAKDKIEGESSQEKEGKPAKESKSKKSHNQPAKLSFAGDDEEEDF